ncbi:MAG: coproporphyrinogen III oxidase [Gemmatimonadetes bacterium]|nr:MAG: coproporphyrinogen III oxidase [Gemmatimonadota bacterium]
MGGAGRRRPRSGIARRSGRASGTRSARRRQRPRAARSRRVRAHWRDPPDVARGEAPGTAVRPVRYCVVPRHVYLHVPFCARRCSYCDFSIAVRRDVPVDEYLSALDAELSVRFGGDAPAAVDTIYLGGGTPSRLGGVGVAGAIALVERHFPLASGGELTIEANPEDVDARAVEAWLAAGVNRLSLGSQSFDDRVLAWMHRTHDGSAIERAVATARAGGIGNLSLDLIFALPAALGRDFEQDVRRLLALAPDHVSLYGLTVESATPLGRWVARGTAVERPEEGYEEEFLAAHTLLTAAGLEHYEVSNYALPGKRARHNSAYWAGVPYVGLGPAAHGFDGTTRRWNARAYASWRDALNSGADPVEGEEQLTEANRIAESVYLQLRSDGGLALLPGERDVVAPWQVAGWVTLDADERLRCTPSGWLRLDALAAALTHNRSR